MSERSKPTVRERIASPKQDAEGRQIPVTKPFGPGLTAISQIMPSALSAVDDPDLAYKALDTRYESPLERLFAYHATKYLNPSVRLGAQITIQTVCGEYRHDFLLQHGQLNVAIETDGKAYHDPIRDLWRDSLILGTGTIDAIVRFSGTDLHRAPYDCLKMLAFWYPSLFSDRGHTNLDQLSARSTRRAIQKYRDGTPEAYREFGHWLEEDDFPTVLYPCSKCEEDESLEVRHSGCPDNPVAIWHRMRKHRRSIPRWKALFEYARQSGCRSLDELIMHYRSSHGGDPHFS
jgi:hypothetical protein